VRWRETAGPFARPGYPQRSEVILTYGLACLTIAIRLIVATRKTHGEIVSTVLARLIFVVTSTTSRLTTCYVNGNPDG